MFEDKIAADRLSPSAVELSEMSGKEAVQQSDSREKALTPQWPGTSCSGEEQEMKNPLGSDHVEDSAVQLTSGYTEKTFPEEARSLEEECPASLSAGLGEEMATDMVAGQCLENNGSGDCKGTDHVGTPSNSFIGRWEGFSAIPEWKPAPKRGLEEAGLYSAYPLPEGAESVPGTASDEELLRRTWEDLSGSHPPELGQPDGGRFEFMVMSYNILSQNLLEMNKNLYMCCQPDILRWEYRFKNILGEIQRWDPDILCLQEVQEDHYREQLESILKTSGYECIYKRRTGIKTDGCAICYKHTKFSLLSAIPIEYFRPPADILNRDNVGLVALLQPLTPESTEAAAAERKPKVMSICVANTHLLYNPRRGDIKLAQTAVLLAEIDRIARISPEEETYYPILLCGDLNAVPDSPLYSFIRNGRLQYRGLLGWKVSGQEDCSHEPYQRRLEVPMLPSFLGITDSCQFAALCKKKKTEADITVKRTREPEVSSSAVSSSYFEMLLKEISAIHLTLADLVSNMKEFNEECKGNKQRTSDAETRISGFEDGLERDSREKNNSRRLSKLEERMEDQEAKSRRSNLRISDRQRYGREFLLQFRYCEAALKRPEELVLIPSVTDLKPEPPADCPQDGTKVIQPDQEPLLTWSTTIKHSLSLTSAYSHFLPEKGHPEVSTLPMGYGATVDYIFYSADPISKGQRGGRRLYRDGPLKLLGRLPLLSQDDLWAANGLPNRLCSSDHLYLLAKFGLDPLTS